MRTLWLVGNLELGFLWTTAYAQFENLDWERYGHFRGRVCSDHSFGADLSSACTILWKHGGGRGDLGALIMISEFWNSFNLPELISGVT